MLPSTPFDRWTGNAERPARVFSTGAEDFELYEEEDAFVLSIEMPGFEREDVHVSWDDGRLHVAAEHEDESRGRRRTYRRTFRMPKDVADEEIAARYRNDILEITLPIREADARGREIEIR